MPRRSPCRRQACRARSGLATRARGDRTAERSLADALRALAPWKSPASPRAHTLKGVAAGRAGAPDDAASHSSTPCPRATPVGPTTHRRSLPRPPLAPHQARAAERGIAELTLEVRDLDTTCYEHAFGLRRLSTLRIASWFYLWPRRSQSHFKVSSSNSFLNTESPFPYGRRYPRLRWLNRLSPGSGLYTEALIPGASGRRRSRMN